MDEENLVDSSVESNSTENLSSLNGSTEQLSNWPRRKQLLNKIFILEPAVLLIFMAKTLSGSVYQNQILYQTCIAIFHYDESDCTPLLGVVSNNSEEAHQIETEVQPVVARILMTRSLFESIFTAFVSLFIGAWSDKFGRRPVMLITLAGSFLSYLIFGVLVIISNNVVLTPWIYLISSIPAVLCGGNCALIAAVYAYITDVATIETRAKRMISNDACLGLGIIIASISVGYIYAATNVYVIFFMSAALYMLAFLYVFFLVLEDHTTELFMTKLREFFRFDLVKDIMRTCLKRRPHYDRALIWLIIITLSAAVFTMEGDATVTYLFMRQKFNLTLQDFNFFNTIRMVIQILGCIGGMVILRRLLKYSVITMSLIALGCCVLESVVRATTAKWWEMYLGVGLGCMNSLLFPMARAILSYVTPTDEIGKVFGLTVSLEALTPFCAAPLYTFVYNATLDINPGVFNWISGGLYVLCFICVSTIFGIKLSFGSSNVYEQLGS
ncbi:tetracycline resistance protein, class A-like [Teleopsis dalmanni]|uniref:tetracycline resistance protein, class A-like n=1 Tax=Teleopsis dalmanni TaxID=139649 RepID=UPI0018CE79F6|nr:tetracycline resistance protein, class A-like [Teleopsis dalmanni]XP_037955860.1 tetracycline resistance protein, class A-like [Teleopsis dalmanni]